MLMVQWKSNKRSSIDNFNETTISVVVAAPTAVVVRAGAGATAVMACLRALQAAFATVFFSHRL